MATEELLDSRSEADQVYGRIPCRFTPADGPVVRWLPTLKIGPAREWKAGPLSEAAQRLGMANIGDAEKALPDLSAFAIGATDEVLDLVIAYDASGALGGREWLEANADDAEVYRVLRSILAVHFPFVDDVRSAMDALGSLFARAPLPEPDPAPAGEPA